MGIWEKNKFLNSKNIPPDKICGNMREMAVVSIYFTLYSVNCDIETDILEKTDIFSLGKCNLSSAVFRKKLVAS